MNENYFSIHDELTLESYSYPKACRLNYGGEIMYQHLSAPRAEVLNEKAQTGLIYLGITSLFED
ncbi:hypothetical protein PCANC_02934 [Puccinia coronata f. sp. avenae]|uniref:Uncharacterized protein n=1 Tax=Puccinia coronata f. sp. avenae TaxID=200324 RepID=A0A2N5T8D2_9BASI|nr:hypothetical protein PCANC_02934 [Puccinia coronata f. sp. avenae]